MRNHICRWLVLRRQFARSCRIRASHGAQGTARALVCCAVVLGLSACEGAIGSAGGPDRDSRAGSGAGSSELPGGGGAGALGASSGGNGGSSGQGGSATETRDSRLAPRVWRLSPAHFNAEIQRLLGSGAPQISIPESADEKGITNIAANAVVDLGNVSIFADGVRSIATWAAAQGAGVSRCDAHGTVPCTDSFLAWFPQSAFRRPVTSGEVAELRGLFDDLEGSYGYDYAFSGVIRAVLLSPDFLYRTELGDASSTQLTPHEIANLLSFSITDQSPDDELLEATEQSDLTDPDARESQARRLMGRSEQIWQRFFWEWLHLSTLESQGNEVGLDPALVVQMEEEYRTFVSEIVVAERGTLRDVLSAPYSWTRPELGAHYGATHPGGGLARIELDPAERGGLLTQGAWLVSHGKRGRDNVVRRGMNIYVDAMCNDITVPPDLDVDAELAKLVGPNPTVREAVEARGTTLPCGNCHRIADPVGMVFESYASSGQWQTTYPDGRQVDSAIEVAEMGYFDNAPAFSAALADDVAFQYCFVQRFAHFLLGKDLGGPGRVTWTQQAHRRFVETDTSLEELLVAIVRHPAFIERQPAEVMQ